MTDSVRGSIHKDDLVSSKGVIPLILPNILHISIIQLDPNKRLIMCDIISWQACCRTLELLPCLKASCSVVANKTTSLLLQCNQVFLVPRCAGMPLLVLIPTLEPYDLLNMVGNALNPPLDPPLLQILPRLDPCRLSCLARCDSFTTLSTPFTTCNVHPPIWSSCSSTA